MSLIDSVFWSLDSGRCLDMTLTSWSLDLGKCHNQMSRHPRKGQTSPPHVTSHPPYSFNLCCVRSCAVCCVLCCKAEAEAWRAAQAERHAGQKRKAPTASKAPAARKPEACSLCGSTAHRRGKKCPNFAAWKATHCG